MTNAIASSLSFIVSSLRTNEFHDRLKESPSYCPSWSHVVSFTRKITLTLQGTPILTSSLFHLYFPSHPSIWMPSMHSSYHSALFFPAFSSSISLRSSCILHHRVFPSPAFSRSSRFDVSHRRKYSEEHWIWPYMISTFVNGRPLFEFYPIFSRSDFLRVAQYMGKVRFSSFLIWLLLISLIDTSRPPHVWYLKIDVFQSR